MWRTLLDFKIGDEVLAKKPEYKIPGNIAYQETSISYTIEILEYLTSKNYVIHLITNGLKKHNGARSGTAGWKSISRTLLHLKPATA